MSKMMSVDNVVQQTRQAMERAAKAATRSPQAARAFLTRAGIARTATKRTGKAGR